jgi:hypothetical protein
MPVWWWGLGALGFVVWILGAFAVVSLVVSADMGSELRLLVALWFSLWSVGIAVLVNFVMERRRFR